MAGPVQEGGTEEDYSGKDPEAKVELLADRRMIKANGFHRVSSSYRIV